MILRKLCKLLPKWAKDDRGTTAIEFSLLAIPFIFLSIGIIELSIMYASASLLEGATGSAARLIRTGQVQQSTGDQIAMFEEALCNYTRVIVNCNDIDYEVIVLDSYSDFEDNPANVDADGNFSSSGVDFGGVSDKILIRTAYRYSMMTPFVGQLLAGPDNARLFMSTIVLQTEPYEFEGS